MEIEKEKMGFEETELRLGLPGNNKIGFVNEGGEVARKRGFFQTMDLKLNLFSKEASTGTDPNDKAKLFSKEKTLLTADPAKPPAKAQVVGWPPVRSFRKNMLAEKKNGTEQESHEKPPVNTTGNATFVKVSMDGAPYLRKVDLKMYNSYKEFSDALSKMFSSFTIGLCLIGNCGAHGMKDFMNVSKLVDLLNGTDCVPTYEDKDGDWMLVGDVPWDMFIGSCKRLRIMKGTEATGLAPKAMEKCKNRS